MTDRIVKRTVVLLPNYFKWIGLGVIILAVIIFLLQSQLENFLPSDDDYGVAVTMLLIGLTLINFSREKLEDERIRRIRYKTFSYSFLSLVTFVLAGRLINQIFGVELTYFSSSTAILFHILLLNLVYFEANKEFDDAEE